MAGKELPMASCTAPSDAVVVRLPAQHPRLMAAGNLNMRCPIIIPKIRGTDVAMMPIRKSTGPTSFNPVTNDGPEAMPTTAMNMFNPRLFISQTAERGRRPKVGCFDLSHPSTRPAISAQATDKDAQSYEYEVCLGGASVCIAYLRNSFVDLTFQTDE